DKSSQLLRGAMYEAIEISPLRQVAEPDATRKISEPAPAEPDDQPRLASAADTQHGDNAGAGVEAARQIEQSVATSHEGITLGGQALPDFPRLQPCVALSDDTIGFCCVVWRNERSVCVADLEQLHRLGKTFHSPIALRLHPPRERPKRPSRLGAHSRFR